MCGFLVAIAFGSAFAQAGGTKAGGSAQIPTVDGILKDGEYRFLRAFDDMRLGVSPSSDGKILYVAIEAPTSGWVAVGLGSAVMNGAFIVLGAYTNGKAVVTEQKGFGHGHTENAAKMVTASAVREAGGKTVMEFAVSASDFLKGAALQVAMSYGATDSFTEKHLKHVSAEIPLPVK